MNADWTQAIFGFGSFIAAAWAVRVALETSREALKTSTQLQRVETFQRMHELLIQPQAAKGRKLLLLHGSSSQNPAPYPNLGDDKWDEINYSLALFDTLGAYYCRNEVIHKDVMDSWRGPLSLLHPQYEDFLAYRRASGIENRWRFLDRLMLDAAGPCELCEAEAAEKVTRDPSDN